MKDILCLRFLPPVLLLALLLLAACGSGAQDDNTATPGQAPGSQSSPAATPTPVLPIPDLLARALERRFVGDDERAAADLLAVLEQNPNNEQARTAYYYLAESYARRGHWSSAVAAFETFLEDFPSNEYTSQALFWLARGYEEAGDWSSAVAVYDRYRALDTPLEPYAAMRQAALYEALGQPERAAQEYTYAATSDVQPGEQAGSYEKAIRLRRQMGQDAEALRLYEELLGVATLPDYRARLLSEAAELADALGQTDQARAWQREIISTAPYSALAVAAVERLLAEGDPALSPAEAARVYFNAERYTDAVPLFDAALQQAPAGSEEALELRRLRALAIRGQGDFGAAMDELARLADDSPPGSDADLQARLDWIQTLGQSGEVDQAAWRYYEYSHTYPTDQRAPEALERAAQLRARLGQTQEAMQIRGELGQRYPQSEQAAPALQQAAWHYYGSARYDTARDMWLLLTQNDEAYEQARGAFWAGRISRSQGDETQARSLFEQAYAAAPDSYYGFRAAEELGISFDGAVPLGAPFSAADWQALATWVDTWATPTNNNSNGAEQAAEAEAVLPEVANSGFVQRAVALRDVGLQVESVGEWNSARDAWDSDPVRLMWLARLAHEHHEPYTALKAATRLQMLAPAEASPVPQTLERLIYPTPYAPLVVAESRAFDVDPRLLYSLMRQESLFNPGATSWVGARGLAQVMPATGEGIAQNLGVADFHIDDLYRPAVSVRFGAYYIGQSMSSMEGSIHGGLAAYNGGLGNAYRWAGGGSSVADADLFTEFIDYPETETYIKRVYGYYGTYQRLYTLP